jgi:hypothetical protein
VCEGVRVTRKIPRCLFVFIDCTHASKLWPYVSKSAQGKRGQGLPPSHNIGTRQREMEITPVEPREVSNIEDMEILYETFFLTFRPRNVNF